MSKRSKHLQKEKIILRFGGGGGGEAKINLYLPFGHQFRLFKMIIQSKQVIQNIMFNKHVLQILQLLLFFPLLLLVVIYIYMVFSQLI